MSESTPATPAPGAARSYADRVRQFFEIDDRVNNVARRVANWLPWRLLSIALALTGSLLIWIAPKPAAMVANLFNGIDCAAPEVGKWLALDCVHAPAFGGWWGIFHLILWFVVFIILCVLVWLVARTFVSLSSRILASDLVRITEPGDIPRKVLVLGLSPLPNGADPDKAIAEAAEWAKDPDCYAGPAGEWRKKAGSDAHAAAGGWQQAARMVRAHLAGGKLKTIYILPSAETMALLPKFQEYLDTLFGRQLAVRPVRNEDGTVFEDTTEEGERRQSYDNYTYLRDGLIRAVEMAKQEYRKEQRGRRLWDNEICVDATAGFKLFSIAAAVVTFDRNIVLGYVVSGGPNPDEGMVKLYDPRLDFLQAVTKKVAETRPAPV
jgi:hypothetical protein